MIGRPALHSNLTRALPYSCSSHTTGVLACFPVLQRITPTDFTGLYQSQCRIWNQGWCGTSVSLLDHVPKERWAERPSDALIDQTKGLFGYPTFGYWKWHNTEEAVQTCDENVRPLSAPTLPTSS
jgi:hypothetical protein